MSETVPKLFAALLLRKNVTNGNRPEEQLSRRGKICGSRERLRASAPDMYVTTGDVRRVAVVIRDDETSRVRARR